MSVKLKWITPDAEKMIVECARVSSDPSLESRPDAHLIRYCLRNGHYSIFEMANICIEVKTTRDIGRQMLRHWTMRPQEFSQRYQDVSILGDAIFREARMQDKKNRQAATPCTDEAIIETWKNSQDRVWNVAVEEYNKALGLGIAKEVARAVLPEGLTPSLMYFNAPVRSVIHFIGTRSDAGAQKEIRDIASGVMAIVDEHLPTIASVMREMQQ